MGEGGWEQGKRKNLGVRKRGKKERRVKEVRMSDERRKRRSERRTENDEKPDIDGASQRER